MKVRARRRRPDCFARCPEGHCRFLSAAEQALALNPLDGAIIGEVALWMSYAATGNAAVS